MEQYTNKPQEPSRMSMKKISSVSANYKTHEKIQLFVMWQILNKRYTVGSKLFYDDINAKVGANKQAYAKARMFLEGAGLIVDEVVIATTVPKNLVERFGLIHDQEKSND
ncbi:hypothetical protein [Enterococcus faecalis]|uniref:hypothetical protein n=1 Tax=Enterococcus TaxID=1350 RepID=UPI000446D343|nr:hypothetical protein [Enterococcus faecalis]EGO2704665.1 hypothetical protein [Enterococcus faecalis]EHM3077764.1 hypothetical protein [Enterococcus faecalis]EHV2922406.1 hypothetical protein [Enterococcus faecalis]EIR8762430.1 hypothetical protein [Enterococcus faecalis]EJZ8850307.1 hypothetical protein [Enterococcus faecalis]